MPLFLTLQQHSYRRKQLNCRKLLTFIFIDINNQYHRKQGHIMKVCIIGNTDSPEEKYVKTCRATGCKATVCSELNDSFDSSIRCSECVLLLSKITTPDMAARAEKLCKKHSIPFISLDTSSPESAAYAMRNYMLCNNCAQAGGCMVQKNLISSLSRGHNE